MPWGFQVYILEAQFDILFINGSPHIIIIKVDLRSLPQSQSWHFPLHEELNCTECSPTIFLALCHPLQQWLKWNLEDIFLSEGDKSSHIQVKSLQNERFYILLLPQNRTMEICCNKFCSVLSPKNLKLFVLGSIKIAWYCIIITGHWQIYVLKSV